MNLELLYAPVGKERHMDLSKLTKCLTDREVIVSDCKIS